MCVSPTIPTFHDLTPPPTHSSPTKWVEFIYRDKEADSITEQENWR